MAEPLVLKDHSGESQIFFDRVIVGFAVLIFLTLVLVARMFYLQVIQHDRYSTLSDKNRIHVQSIPPTRGLVLDREGLLIASNEPSYQLTLVREHVADMGETIAQLRSIIEVKPAELESFKKRSKRRKRPFQSVPLKMRLTEEQIARVLVNGYRLAGVQVEARLVRHYPMGPLMAHALGSVRRINEDDMQKLDPVAYSGTDHIGKLGIEKFYEQHLLGTVGYRKVESNAMGRVVKELSTVKPVPGRDLRLYLDAGLQQVASDALDGRRGAVVAMDPRTGGILALVSMPSYDPNLFVTGIDQKSYSRLRDSPDVPLFNRALQGQYEPGSTLKPFIGLAGLVHEAVSPDFTIEDPGWFRLPNNKRLYRDWNWRTTNSGGHGNVNLDKAIYRSCNVFFYGLAVKLGIETLHDHLWQFGFGQNLAHDLPEARSGLLPSKAWKEMARGEPWYPGDTVNIGIGQGDMLVTPLQLATAVSVLAQRGRLVQPRMLMGMGGETPATLRGGRIGIGDAGVWESIIESMEKVVHRGNQEYGENGTAWAYIGRDIPYRMAGKSGTAQVVGIKQDEEYDEEELDERLRKHAWFIAFAPVDNPLIAVAVLVENGGGGSAVAAPVARAVLDEYLVASGRIAGL